MRKEFKIDDRTKIELYTEDRGEDDSTEIEDYVTIYQLGEEVTLTAQQLHIITNAMKLYIYNKD